MPLFDSSMSALPILCLHLGTRVSLFTCQQGTWAGFRPSRDRLVLSYCCHHHLESFVDSIEKGKLTFFFLLSFSLLLLHSWKIVLDSWLPLSVSFSRHFESFSQISCDLWTNITLAVTKGLVREEQLLHDLCLLGAVTVEITQILTRAGQVYLNPS